jgi:hypothetical protein
MDDSGPLIMRFSVCRRYSWTFRPIPSGLAALLHKIAATFRFVPGHSAEVAPHLAAKKNRLDHGASDAGAASGMTKDQAEACLDWLENHGQRGVLEFDPQSGFAVRRG